MENEPGNVDLVENVDKTKYMIENKDRELVKTSLWINTVTIAICTLINNSRTKLLVH